MRSSVCGLARRAALLLAALAAGCGEPAGRSRVGEPFPALQLARPDGTAGALSDYRGRALVVNFWATWCAPCREEMPSLQRLAGRYRGQAVEVIGVSVDDDANLVREYLLKQNLTFPILLDRGGALAARLAVPGYPHTYLVSPEGIIVGEVTGARQWDAPQQVAAVAAALGVAPGPPTSGL